MECIIQNMHNAALLAKRKEIFYIELYISILPTWIQNDDIGNDDDDDYPNLPLFVVRVMAPLLNYYSDRIVEN